MRLLVTGASGFIGKNFLELAPKDIEIIGIYNSSKEIEDFVKEKKLNNVKLYKCDLTKKEEVERLFEKIPCIPWGLHVLSCDTNSIYLRPH